MSEHAVTSTAARGWPMTPEAARSLASEIGQVRHDIAALAGEGFEEGVVHLSLAQAVRRLETLLATQRYALPPSGQDCVAIGRVATVRHADGEVVDYSVVCPGDGDPARRCVSADSPLGSALLGARPGATVEVVAPGGSWSVAVLAVD